MSKTIFVLIDGLGYEAAEENLGFLEHLAEQGMGIKARVLSELPSSSRPLYETLMTGLPVVRHGIVNNLVIKRSDCRSIFDLCGEKGLKTAASAYYWMSELYSKAPFDMLRDRISLNKSGAVDYGIYYFEDSYPDSHVLADAEYLRTTYDPYFMLVHTMNVDDAGHAGGGGSVEYQKAAAKLNIILSSALPLWIKEGYDILVTSDHGMNEFGLHGGNSPRQREVPLYLVSNKLKKRGCLNETIPQLAVAPMLCQLLDLKKTEEMKSMEELGVDLFE